MALYRLQRVADQKLFSAQRENTDAAMFYFSVLTGEALSLNGDGPPPYLLGSRVTPVGRIDTTVPVYRKDG